MLKLAKTSPYGLSHSRRPVSFGPAPSTEKATHALRSLPEKSRVLSRVAHASGLDGIFVRTLFETRVPFKFSTTPNPSVRERVLPAESSTRTVSLKLPLREGEPVSKPAGE